MTSTDEWLRIESLDLEAQGVAHNAEGKVVFIEGALPGEEVQVAVHRRKNNWEQAALVALRRESAQRVVPRCPHFGVLRRLQDAAPARRRAGGDQAARARGRALAPRQGPARAACCGRSRGRPGAIASAPASRCATSSKKGTVLVGFHERKSSYVADMPQLRRPAAARERHAAAAARADRRDGRARPPAADRAGGRRRRSTALVLRHLEPLRRGRPGAAARASRATHGVQWWLQPKGPGHRAAARRRRRRRWPTRCPSSASRCRSGRPISPRSTRTSTACWSSRALRLLDVAARRARDRLVLRPRQLHAAAGDAGRATVLGIEGSDALVARARATTPRR